MARLPSIRRLRTDEFPNKYNDLTSKLVYGINQFFEAMYNALNKQLTFRDNFLALDVEVSFTAPINASNTVTIRNDLGLPIRAALIRRVDNNTDSVKLTQAPYVEFENGQNQIILNNGIGFVDGKQYTIRLLFEP